MIPQPRPPKPASLATLNSLSACPNDLIGTKTSFQSLPDLILMQSWMPPTLKNLEIPKVFQCFCNAGLMASNATFEASRKHLWSLLGLILSILGLTVASLRPFWSPKLPSCAQKRQLFAPRWPSGYLLGPTLDPQASRTHRPQDKPQRSPRSHFN